MAKLWSSASTLPESIRVLIHTKPIRALGLPESVSVRKRHPGTTCPDARPSRRQREQDRKTPAIFDARLSTDPGKLSHWSMRSCPKRPKKMGQKDGVLAQNRPNHEQRGSKMPKFNVGESARLQEEPIIQSRSATGNAKAGIEAIPNG